MQLPLPFRLCFRRPFGRNWTIMGLFPRICAQYWRFRHIAGKTQPKQPVPAQKHDVLKHAAQKFPAFRQMTFGVGESDDWRFGHVGPDMHNDAR